MALGVQTCASLLGARPLLGAPGLTKLGTRMLLGLGTKGITTTSKSLRFRDHWCWRMEAHVEDTEAQKVDAVVVPWLNFGLYLPHPHLEVEKRMETDSM